MERDFATAMRLLQMKYIITNMAPLDGIERWNICDNKEIDLDIVGEKDLIDFSKEN